MRIASVAGEQINRQISDFVLQQWQLKAEFARTAAQTAGVTNSYSDPAEWVWIVGWPC